MGHAVTVFEKEDRIGGILRNGIPDFKLEKWVIDRRLEQLVEEGIDFQTSVHIGDDLSARYLGRAFDAVLVAMGAGQPRDLERPRQRQRGHLFRHGLPQKVEQDAWRGYPTNGLLFPHRNKMCS